MPRVPAPIGHQDDGTGQGGDEYQDAVHHRNGDALSSAQPDRAERPRGRTLARAPAGDVRRHRRGQQHDQCQWEQPTHRQLRPGQLHRDHEHRDVAHHGDGGGEHDARPGPPREHRAAEVTADGARDPGRKAPWVQAQEYDDQRAADDGRDHPGDHETK